MTRVELQPAQVLHQRPYRETSLIVEVFGRDTGRVSILAKGARRPRSRERGVLQPFRPLLLSWSARRELALLTGAEVDGFVRPLAGESLYSGLYMNELLMRLLHRHDPHPELYQRYAQTLEALRRGEPAAAVLRVFEKHLLDAIGYGLVLDREVETDAPLEAERVYRYQTERGPVASGSGPGIPVAGATLLGLAREELASAQSLSEARRLMRDVIRHHLGDKPLATRELFRRQRHR